MTGQADAFAKLKSPSRAGTMQSPVPTTFHWEHRIYFAGTVPIELLNDVYSFFRKNSVRYQCCSHKIPVHAVEGFFKVGEHVHGRPKFSLLPHT